MPGHCSMGRSSGHGCSSVPEAVETHPCFSETAHHVFARMHVPVAPRCNIRCNYCNRLYDCPNESRPGVTSDVLAPREALDRAGAVLHRLPNLTVVGVAGPGDPLANGATIETLQLVHQAYPHLTLCISTNGLMLADMVEDLVGAHVSTVSVTMNAVDPEVGERICSAVRYRGSTYRGREAAELLAGKQREGIEIAVRRGIVVKVNCVMIPGVNDTHLIDVARVTGALGVHSVNIMPLIPVAGTRFGGRRPPSVAEVKRLQDLCEPYVKQMRHCRQCRADAVGLLDEELSAEFARVQQGPIHVELARRQGSEASHRTNGAPVFRAAVATKDGHLVNQHFGHAGRFLIYELRGDEVVLVGTRSSRTDRDWDRCGEMEALVLQTIDLLCDCHVMITSHMGARSRQEFLRAGIQPIRTYGPIEAAVRLAARAFTQDGGVPVDPGEGRI